MSPFDNEIRALRGIADAASSLRFLLEYTDLRKARTSNSAAALQVAEKALREAFDGWDKIRKGGT